MSGPSFRAGWRRARVAGRVTLGAWIGRLAVALPLALALAAGLDRLFAAASAGRDLPPDTDAEAALRFIVSLLRDVGPYGVVVVVTLLAAAAWEVLWQGGLAAAWRDGLSGSPRRSVAAGWSLLWPLARLAVSGVVVQGLFVGVAMLATASLLGLGDRGPWWTAPLVRVVRITIVGAVWALAHASVQLARWRVARGGGPLRALIGSTLATLRHPVASVTPVVCCAAWSLGWAALWLAMRIIGTIGSTGGAWSALALLVGVILAETWGRTALVLAYAPPDAPSS